MAENVKLKRQERFDPVESEINVIFKYTYESPEVFEDVEIEILKIETEYGNDITDLITEEEFEYIEDFLYDNWEDTSSEEMTDHKFDQDKEK